MLIHYYISYGFIICFVVDGGTPLNQVVERIMVSDIKVLGTWCGCGVLTSRSFANVDSIHLFAQAWLETNTNTGEEVIAKVN